MKNRLSTKIHVFFYGMVWIGLAFGQTACSSEKTNPAVDVSPVQNRLDSSSTSTPFSQFPAVETATPVPDVTGQQTAENSNIKNENNTETLTPETSLYVVSTQVSPIDGMVMVFVPQGEFLMGVDKDNEYGFPNPGYTVYLDAYWIDQTDVTNAMYALCVDAGACHEPHSPKNVDTVFKGDNQPAGFVNWNDADDYCRWAGRRLPTDAEWEKAARGTDGRTYPWGNQKPAGNLLNFADINSSMQDADKNIDDGYKFTSPVWNYPDGASPYGALDMAGNAFQWVQDWDGNYYVNPPYINPQGPSSGEDKILRGGSCFNDERAIRSMFSLSIEPSSVAGNISFRCAMNAESLN